MFVKKFAYEDSVLKSKIQKIKRPSNLIACVTLKAVFTLYVFL